MKHERQVLANELIIIDQRLAILPCCVVYLTFDKSSPVTSIQKKATEQPFSSSRCVKTKRFF